MKNKSYYNDIHHWFGLSYSSYLVMPRAVLSDLPEELQHQILNILQYIEDTYKNEEFPGSYMVRAKKDNKFIKDPLVDYRHVDMNKFRRSNEK